MQIKQSYNCHLQLMKEREWEIPPSSTQRVATLKRNMKLDHPPYSFTSQDYISQLAKARLLEDELMTEKFKVEAMERKVHEYSEVIGSMEFNNAQLKIQLDRANEQIRRQMSRDKIMEEYEFNLREIGSQITSLNNILQKKNKQCHALLQMNTSLKIEISDLQQRLENMLKKRQREKQALLRVLKLFEAQGETSFNDETEVDIFKIEECVIELKNQLTSAKNIIEKNRRDNSDSLLKQKQQIISLEYALKLANQRNHDLEKKKSLENSFVIDKRLEDVIEEMLKKEDELSSQISDLQAENDELRENLDDDSQNRYHYYHLRQQDLNTEISMLKNTIEEIKNERSQLTERLQQFTSQSEIQVSRIRSQQHQLNKKYRQGQEQNKRLRLRLIQLQSDKQMLQKQLYIRNQ